MSFEDMYYKLFHSVTDAVNQLELQNYGAAKEILIQAQQNCEENYLTQREKPED